MKIKNIELIATINVLSSCNNKKLPQKISYAITRNHMILEKEYQYYDKELKNIFSQYEKYFDKDNNGKNILNSNGIPKIKSEYKESNENEFLSKINELLNIEIDIDFYTIDEYCFNYDDGNGKYDVLSPIEIINLQRILCGVGMNEH